MRVNLGSGDQFIEGFINIDERDLVHPSYCQWNLKNGLPPHLKDIEIVTSSHFFEHLMWHDALKLMKECREKMVEGGIFNMCLPDFRLLVTKYLERDWQFFSHTLCYAPDHQLMQLMNFSLYQYTDGVAEHKQMYDAEYAIFTLQEAGFKDCKEVPFNPEYNLANRVPYSIHISGIK